MQERAADPAAPFAALVFKVSSTATGRLTYLRVYSGTIRKGDTVLDAGAGRTERIGRILRVQADRHAEVDRAVAGDIVAVVGLKAARAGATLCAPAAPLVLEPPAVAEPVVSVAVEARRSTRHRPAGVGAGPAGRGGPLAGRSGPTPRPVRRVLSGMGELHLEVAVEKIRRAHGLEVGVGRPQVAYRETVARGVSGLVYRHVKQDGGAGQFAHVVLDVEPLAPDATGLRVPVGRRRRTGAAGVRPGGRGRLPGRPGRGPARRAPGDRAAGHADRRGHPSEGLLGDGVPHGGPARRSGRRCAPARWCCWNRSSRSRSPCPRTPSAAVLGDLAARRGRVSGSTARPGTVVITATVPLAELFGYATRLRSRTQGRGTFTTRAAGYAPPQPAVPVDDGPVRPRTGPSHRAHRALVVASTVLSPPSENANPNNDLETDVFAYRRTALQRVIVNLADKAFDGILWAQRGPLLVLREPNYFSPALNRCRWMAR